MEEQGTTRTPTPAISSSLAALAERVCAASGTELAVVLADLEGGCRHEATPAALRAGWHAPDLELPRLHLRGQW